MNTGLVIISLCACKCYSLRCLPQKGRTKEHVIVQPNPTLPHHPHPPSPSTASTFTFSLFSLFFFHFECSTFITSHPIPLAHSFFYFSFPPPPVPLRLLSLRLPLLLLCPFVSLSLFLCSSLNYWKQNGLKTKTQADVA